MTATQDDTIAELQRAIAELRRERDAGLAREAALAEALAAAQQRIRRADRASGRHHRRAEGDVRLTGRYATGVRSDRAPGRELCDGRRLRSLRVDGTVDALSARRTASDVALGSRVRGSSFRGRVTGQMVAGRAILERRVIHIDDMAADPDVCRRPRSRGHCRSLAIPLLRDGEAIGAIALGTGDAAASPTARSLCCRPSPSRR